MNEPTELMMDAAYNAYHECGKVDDEATFDEALREAITAALQVMPRETVPVKLTFVRGEAELELEPFNQGVHLERFDPTAPVSIYDTAGKPTENAVARWLPNIGWMIEGDRANAIYERVHVQAMVPAPAPGVRVTEKPE